MSKLKRPTKKLKTSKSSMPNRSLVYFGVAALVVLTLFSAYKVYGPKPQSIGINEVTTGGVKQGSVPSVTITTANGSGYTFSYGYGGGFNGNSKIKMDGVIINNAFYKWGYSGPATGFNPSRGVQYGTLDGKYTSYGSTVTEHTTPLVYSEVFSATPRPTSPNQTGNSANRTVTPSVNPSSIGALFYYNISLKRCVATSAIYNLTSQKTSSGTSCSANIKQFFPNQTTGICYETSIDCYNANRTNPKN